MSYITEDEIEKYMGVDIDAALSVFIASVISMAENYIEKYCGGKFFAKRWFADSDTEITMWYNGNGLERIAIDDLRDITSLELNGIALVEDTDYILYPLNAAALDEPYEWIELVQPDTRIQTNSRIISSSAYIFDEGQKNIKVVGKFGYSTTPPSAIKLAALKIVSGVIKENIGDNDLKEITQESIGEYSASYAKVSEVANAKGINDILNSFTRKGIPKRNKVVKID